MAKITIPATGTSFDVADGDTIARAAVRNGLGFPYDCNVGECGNCRFELLEGEVTYLRENPPALNDRDAQRKRYLGCQALPNGDCSIKVSLRDQFKSTHLPAPVTGTLTQTLDITYDIREFRFKLEQPNRFLPGQYALISVPGVNGARAYSMCNVTDDGAEWHFQIRKVPNGAASSGLFERVNMGDTINLDGPYGMAYLREDAPRDLLLIAGGSGLSPMISIARAAAHSAALKERKIHFLFGGRTPRDICGEDILKELPGFGERLLYYPAISMPDDAASAGWTGKTGFVNDVASEIFGDDLSGFEAYFAGPPVMAQSVMKTLIKGKVPAAQMHFDQFY